MFGLGTPELLVIVVILVILFGAGGIAQVARALGQTQRELKQLTKEIQQPLQDIRDAQEETSPLIEPPLLVFVSSVMNPQCEDLKPERAAAKKAIEAFPPLTRAWRFEDSPASSESAGRVYLDKVKACDIFVLVVGKDITRPVLKEYATARRKGKPCLMFLKRETRAPETETFIKKIRPVLKYAEFEAAAELDHQVWRALATFLIQQARNYKLNANDVAVLTLFLEQLPKLELSEPKIQVSEQATPQAEQSLELLPVKEGRDGKRMILSPAGWFLMGTSEADILEMSLKFGWKLEQFEDERPQRKIYLDAYYMDETPVTNAEYKKFVDATGHGVPYGWDKNWRTFPHTKDNHPVVDVTWDDANAYARWAGKRLPTEAEWEKAARGGIYLDGDQFRQYRNPNPERFYPWGNEQPDASRCNFNFDEKDTTQVGNYSPRGDSPYGVIDMAGNVWEYCMDWYGADYYANSPSHNPTGPLSGTRRDLQGGWEPGPRRVVRGGSKYSSAFRVRIADRGYDFNPAGWSDPVGFRCVE